MDERRVLRRLAYASDQWWLSLIIGIFFLITGIWVLLSPAESYIALSILFIVALIGSGIAEIFSAFTMRKESSAWGWVLAGGILDLLIASLLATDPALTLTILSFFIGFALLFRSAMAIGVAFDLRHNSIRQWKWLLFMGIIGLIFSFIILKNPVIVGLTFVFWTGLAFISIGIFRIFLSIKLRQFRQELFRAAEE